MLRKIFKTGHSSVVAVPHKYLKQLGLKAGDMVNVELDPERQQLFIRQGNRQKQQPLNLKLRPKL